MKRGPFSYAQPLKEALERAEYAEARLDQIRQEFTEFTLESNKRYDELRVRYHAALDRIIELRAQLDNIADSIDGI